ncbi:hypothetical protein PFTANZ_05871, partial [Plasmodium falciparum Tanzania (2000708)]
MLGKGMESPDFVLQYNLQIEFLNEDSTQDTQNSLDSEELKHLKHLSEMLQKENIEEPAGGSPVTEQKNIMDKLIDYEEKEAKKCKEKNPEKCPEDTPGGPGAGRARSATDPSPDSPDDNEDEDDEDDEDDDSHHDDDGAEEVPPEEETEEVVEETVAEVTDTSVDVCKIVDNIFKDTSNFSDACGLKYGKNYGWKCVPTTSGGSGVPTTTDKSGGVCIPPRRRRLYVGKLETLDTDSTSQNDVKTA